MDRILRDPIWQFIGALVALLGIAVSIILLFVQRNRKSLAYDIVTATRLVGISDILTDRVQVLFDGQPTTDVWLVLVRIFNDGNAPIQTVDYEHPVEINFHAKILQIEVQETVPDDIDLALTQSYQSVSLSPTLLNVMDSVTVKALVGNLVQPPTVSARIVGVKQIRKVGHVSVFPSSMPVFWFGIALILTSGIVSAWMTTPSIFIGGLIAGLAILTTPIFYDYRFRRFWTRWMLG